MKAFILAAGLGTRLAHLTKNQPKALVEYKQKPLLQHVIEKLKNEGITEIVINVHHFGEQIIDFLEQNNSFGMNIQISDERKELLDTGGALLFARTLLEDSSEILIYNTDIESNIDIKKLLEFHQQNKALATLALDERNSSRSLLFTENNELKAWRNNQSGETKGKYSVDLKNFSFGGVHIVSNQIFSLIEETGKFSIIDLYLRLSEKNRILGYFDKNSYFRDLGKISVFET
jgi:NDP-sugar pyrophosphorylase family protein